MEGFCFGFFSWKDFKGENNMAWFAFQHSLPASELTHHLINHKPVFTIYVQSW